MKLQKSLCIAFFGLAFAPQADAAKIKEKQDNPVFIEEKKELFPKRISEKLQKLERALQSQSAHIPVEHYIYDSETKKYKKVSGSNVVDPLGESFFESVKRGAKIFTKIDTQTYKKNPPLTDVIDVINFLFFAAIPKKSMAKPKEFIEESMLDEGLIFSEKPKKTKNAQDGEEFPLKGLVLNIESSSDKADNLAGKLITFFDGYAGALFGDLSQVPEDMFSKDKDSGTFSIHLLEKPKGGYFGFGGTPRNLWFGNPKWKSFAFVKQGNNNLRIQPHSQNGAIPPDLTKTTQSSYRLTTKKLKKTTQMFYLPPLNIKKIQSELTEVLKHYFTPEQIPEQFANDYYELFQNPYTLNSKKAEQLANTFIETHLENKKQGKKALGYILRTAVSTGAILPNLSLFLRVYQHPIFTQLNPGGNKATYCLLMAMIAAELKNSDSFVFWLDECEKMVKKGTAPDNLISIVDEAVPAEVQNELTKIA